MASTEDASAGKIKWNLWCKAWLRKRQTYSPVNLLNGIKFWPKDYLNYLRMNEETHLSLLPLVAPLIKKEDTVMRKAILPHERLFEQNKHIIFLWTSGHAGIRGNELADEAARRATEARITDVPLRLDDAKATLNQQVFNAWQREWNSSNNYLKLFKPTITKWSLPPLTRREQLLEITPNPIYSFAGDSTLTPFLETGQPLLSQEIARRRYHSASQVKGDIKEIVEFYHGRCSMKSPPAYLLLEDFNAGSLFPEGYK
nr:unnamed protein product [Callosobruchus analis]